MLNLTRRLNVTRQPYLILADDQTANAYLFTTVLILIDLCLTDVTVGIKLIFLRATRVGMLQATICTN